MLQTSEIVEDVVVGILYLIFYSRTYYKNNPHLILPGAGNTFYGLAFSSKSLRAPLYQRKPRRVATYNDEQCASDVRSTRDIVKMFSTSLLFDHQYVLDTRVLTN